MMILRCHSSKNIPNLRNSNPCKPWAKELWTFEVIISSEFRTSTYTVGDCMVSIPNINKNGIWEHTRGYQTCHLSQMRESFVYLNYSLVGRFYLGSCMVYKPEGYEKQKYPSNCWPYWYTEEEKKGVASWPPASYVLTTLKLCCYSINPCITSNFLLLFLQGSVTSKN